MAQACSYWHLGDIDKWSKCFLAKFETKPRTLMKVDLEIELAYINIFRICHSLLQIKTYCACLAQAQLTSHVGLIKMCPRSSGLSVARQVNGARRDQLEGSYISLMPIWRLHRVRDFVACVLSFCCIAHTPLRPSDTFAALSSAAAVCRLPP